MEAKPDWPEKSLVLYPQIVFEHNGPQIRVDYDEMIGFGKEAFKKVLVKAMLQAFRHFEAREKRWLHLERIELNQPLTKRYHFPPRIFTRHSISELSWLLAANKRTSFILRYLNFRNFHAVQTARFR